MRVTFAPDRYEAAIRLERITQKMREYGRYGMTITESMVHERTQAEREYDLATAAISKGAYASISEDRLPLWVPLHG